jgi:hypothetical protein
MPKDPKRNVDRYKIRGGEINEFEFHQNQAELEKQQQQAAKSGAKKSAPRKAGKKRPKKAT